MTIKIAERADAPGRLQDKDALDVLRLLRAVPTNKIVMCIQSLVADPRARATTVEGIRELEKVFGTTTAIGSVMAARALERLSDPETIRASCAALTEEMLDAGAHGACAL
jgi:hypothetical protein